MGKTIWIFNHYATNMFFSKNGRHVCFARELMKRGYNARVFCASTRHNSSENLITDGRAFFEDDCDGVPFVFVKCCGYTGNGKARVLNMLDYYRGLFRVTRHFEKPDVIIGSSVHPLACVAAIKLSNRYHCKNIVEIRDLWPESIVAYSIRKKSDPVVKLLYRLERWIYAKADAIIFTMEGGRDYMIEKGWDKAHGGPVDMGKVHHINNGVDLEKFKYNKESFPANDADLDDQSVFKAVYTGSIRAANHLGGLLDVAMALKKRGNSTKILIYGDGSERDELERSARQRGLDSVVFKGKVNKERIPAILAQCDLCLMHGQPSPIARYGMSMNKSFEYMASGKPILSTYANDYDYIEKNGCGRTIGAVSSEAYADAIEHFEALSFEDYARLCRNSQDAAQAYDFPVLTEKLIGIIEGLA